MHEKYIISEQLQKAREYQERESGDLQMAPKQRFHVCAPVGWINDPNGFSVYQGEYHLFYQYHPYSTVWGPMHWGHVKTKDFICWEQLPPALAPDTDYDKYGCFSGSAVQWKDKHVLLYTGVSRVQGEHKGGVRQTQCVAVGDGINYEKSSLNPVISADSLPAGSSPVDFRDPLVWVEDDVFYLVAANRAKDGSGQIVYYKSDNLEQWELESVLYESRNEFGKMWECPDLFRLGGKDILMFSPQEVERNDEFHSGNCTAFMIGDFNKEEKSFIRERIHAVDYGLDFYAPQTVKTLDGRRVLIGWMASWDNPLYPDTFGWSGCMSIPRELILVNNRIFQQPVKELECYHTNPFSLKEQVIRGVQEWEELNSRFLDITIELEGDQYSRFTLQAAVNESCHTDLIYHREQSEFEINREYSGLARDAIACRRIPVEEKDNRFKMRVILDRYSVEVFMNDGEKVMSMLIFTDINADRVRLIAEGSVKADIVKYEIGTLRDLCKT